MQYRFKAQKVRFAVNRGLLEQSQKGEAVVDDRELSEVNQDRVTVYNDDELRRIRTEAGAGNDYYSD